MSNIGNKETFAKNLQYYIARSHRSQKEIAEAVGVSPSTFNEWVKGKKYPRIDKIEMLANYFGILKSDLIEEKNNKKNELTAQDDKLSNNKKKLIDFAMNVPDDKVELLLKVMKSIVEAD